MNLFKTWAFMLAIFVPFYSNNVLISSPPCSSVCFAMHASFHTALKFLPQDISSSRIPSVEIMSYRDSTFVPKGHQTYEEIKDLSEKCQREKGDCLTKEFVSRFYSQHKRVFLNSGSHVLLVKGEATVRGIPKGYYGLDQLPINFHIK